MDDSGIEAKTTFRIPHVRWDEIAKVTVDRSEGSVLLVYPRSGKRFKIAAAAFEHGWDRKRIASEMRRLSGGRIRVSR